MKCLQCGAEVPPERMTCAQCGAFVAGGNAGTAQNTMGNFNMGTVNPQSDRSVLDSQTPVSEGHGYKRMAVVSGTISVVITLVSSVIMAVMMHKKNSGLRESGVTVLEQLFRDKSQISGQLWAVACSSFIGVLFGLTGIGLISGILSFQQETPDTKSALKIGRIVCWISVIVGTFVPTWFMSGYY